MKHNSPSVSEISDKTSTHIPNDTIAYTFLGMCLTKAGMTLMASSEVIFIALVPNEYIVGAHALGDH